MPEDIQNPCPDAAVDNDVLIKAACYGLIDHLFAPQILGVLGAARYVVIKRIRKIKLTRDQGGAQESALKLIARSSVLEPTDDELRLAAAIETVAQRRALELDAGESQLAAMVLLRAIPVLETGDKRAIRGFEVLVDELTELAPLRGRLRCLEQIILRYAECGDTTALTEAICAEPAIDKALSICFHCFSPAPHGSVFDRDGIVSYIEALRADAPRVLEP